MNLLQQIKGKDIEQIATVSVPLRGSGNESVDSQLPDVAHVLTLFPSPCGEVVMNLED